MNFLASDEYITFLGRLPQDVVILLSRQECRCFFTSRFQQAEITFSASMICPGIIMTPRSAIATGASISSQKPCWNRVPETRGENSSFLPTTRHAAERGAFRPGDCQTST